MRATIHLGLASLLAVFTIACGDQFRSFDASVAEDAGVSDAGLSSDGGVPVAAAFTISGCTTLSFDQLARPVCVATPERPLTFVPLGVGVESVLWTFAGGSPPTSTTLTPEALWTHAGSYDVTLAAAGGGGAALGTGTVNVVAGAAGDTCASDSDCDASTGLTCLCGDGDHCPGGLAAGLCARRCESAPCDVGEQCVDLTRGGAAAPDGGSPDGGSPDAYRVRVCLPACSASTTCRAGFSCLPLPVVAVGAPSGGAYSWGSACFADVLGQVGAPCRAADGTLDDASCLTGHCEALGARGVCTDVCGAGATCPTQAVCANIASIGPRCLVTCATATGCDDPLLDCVGPGAGGLGYTLPPEAPANTMLCAEKRCTQPSDCTPAGDCTPVDGADFCTLP